MSRHHRITVLVAAVLVGCAMGGGGGPPAPPTLVTVSPATARPGDVVLITHTHGDLKSRHGLEATIGGERAVILHIVDDDHADIIVPIISPDSVAVVISDEDGEFATGNLTVLATARVLVILAVSDSVRVARVYPSVDMPTGDVLSNEERLSFDLLNAAGALVHSCSVLDPAHAPGEAVQQGSGPDQLTMTREGLSTDPIVAIRLPRLVGKGILRVFRVAPGLDITTERGRSQRALIDTTTVSF